MSAACAVRGTSHTKRTMARPPRSAGIRPITTATFSHQRLFRLLRRAGNQVSSNRDEESMSTDRVDVALIGAGIMSATLGTLLHELDPSLSIAIFERLDRTAAESSDAWNNAGTGHA